ncbi:MAG: YkgJ family cysteine cluster protein [archaeon]
MIYLKSDEENQKLCGNCSLCCKYITLLIDTPVDKKDVDETIWFLLHEGISVYITKDNQWHVEVKTMCKELDKQERCDSYQERPLICREHSQDDCEKYDNSNEILHWFETREDFLDYIEKSELKKIYF